MVSQCSLWQRRNHQRAAVRNGAVTRANQFHRVRRRRREADTRQRPRRSRRCLGIGTIETCISLVTIQATAAMAGFRLRCPGLHAGEEIPHREPCFPVRKLRCIGISARSHETAVAYENFLLRASQRLSLSCPVGGSFLTYISVGPDEQGVHAARA